MNLPAASRRFFVFTQPARFCVGGIGIKKINTIVIITAGVMLFPLFFGLINSGWFIRPIIKNKYSTDQIEEICRQFKFQLSSDETISTEYFPGFLQGTTHINIHVNNVRSEEDFLSRFSGKILEQEGTEYNYTDDVENGASYKIELFQLDDTPKDYHCELRFHKDDDNLTACYYISGYIPQLKTIYKNADNPLQPYLSNRMFMLPFVIEVLFALFLLIQAVIYLTKKSMTYFGRKKNSYDG